MGAPGELEDLEENFVVQWNARVASRAQSLKNAAGNFYAQRLGFQARDHLVLDGDPRLSSDVLAIDWDAFPTRFERAVGSARASRAFAARTPAMGDVGRRAHEEYMEWRDVRGVSDRLIRWEATTETMDYWTHLAGRDPARTLQILAEFAREPSVHWRDVYGAGEPNDPFRPGRTVEQRERSFQAQMLYLDGGVASPYNNGLRAIAFMAVGFNSLDAAINLAAFGAQAAEIGNGPASAGKAIAHYSTLGGFGAAVDCRNSDPTIFGATIDAAWSGAALALADPVGIYIKNVRRDGLLMPDGATAIPENWWRLSRGKLLGEGASKRSGFQRLTLEVPAGIGFVISDLVIADSGEKVKTGADLARLVTVGLHVKKSAASVIPGAKLVLPDAAAQDCFDPNGASANEILQTVQQIEQQLEPVVTAFGMRRG
jgi:hypothetical protein